MCFSTLEFPYKRYPEALVDAPGLAQPPTLRLWGALSRLEALQCAMIGSRQTSPLLLRAGHELAFALARAGIVVTSGLARGSDFAAHEGAAQAQGAGTLAVLPCGLLKVSLAGTRLPQSQITYVSIAEDEAPFHVSTALKRNAVIAALAGGLVVVETGVRGGSYYAIRHAIAGRKPVWCFEAGARTPEGNRLLIASGQAKALNIEECPERLAEEILAQVRKKRSKGRVGGERYQADWLGSASIS